MAVFDRLRRRLLLALTAVLALAACNNRDEDIYQGYVEGDYLYLASPQAGYLQTLAVDRGSCTLTPDLVPEKFLVSAEPESYELNEAEAQALSTQQKIRNLQAPRRPAEIAALQGHRQGLG